MFTHLYSHRDTGRFSFRERRLCFMPSANPNVPRQPSFWERMQEFGADTVENFKSFFSNNPQIAGAVFERIRPDASTIEELKQLTNDHNWLHAFRTHDEILRSATLSQKQDEDPVYRFLRTSNISLEQRQDMFFEYVDQYIPADVQEIHFVDDAWSGRTNGKLDATERFTALSASHPDKINEVIDSLSLSLGDDLVNTATGKAVEIATSSLKEHYGITAGTTIDSSKLDRSLAGDYRSTLESLRLRGYPPAETSPENLQRNLTSSRLLGALKLGVINRSTLEFLNKDLASVIAERDRTINTTSRDLDEEMLVTKDAIKMRAETLRDRWDSMGGIGKLILLAAAAFGIYKFPKTSLFFGGLYVLSKMVTGVDPADVGLQKLRNSWLDANAKNAKMYDFFGVEVPGDPSWPVKRTSLMANFLTDYDRDGLEAETEFFSINMNIQLQHLANSFDVVNSGAATTWNLDLSPGGNIDKALKASDRKRYRVAIESAKKRNPNAERQFEDALAYVFYLIAKKDPRNAKSIESESGYLYVDEAVRDLPADQSFTELTGKPREAYADLVLKGKLMAANSTETLGGFIQEHLQMNEVIPVDSARSPLLVSESDATISSAETDAAAVASDSDSPVSVSVSESDAGAESSDSDTTASVSESGAEAGDSDSDSAVGISESDASSGAASSDVASVTSESAASIGDTESESARITAESDADTASESDSAVGMTNDVDRIQAAGNAAQQSGESDAKSSTESNARITN